MDNWFGLSTSMKMGGGLNVPAPKPLNGFITTWKTDNTGPSNNDQIVLPLDSGGTYNFDVDWGDGTSNTITTWNQAETTHTFPSAGTYTVTITGTIRRFRFNNAGDVQKLLNIANWGPLDLGNISGSFYGCINMTCTALDRPVVGTTAASLFRNCQNFNGAVDRFDMSSTTNISSMFNGCTVFNQAVNSWDTSSVTVASSAFTACAAFNQPVNNWYVSGITSGNNLFSGCSSFNSSVDGWTLTNMTGGLNMFLNCSSFNQPLTDWTTPSLNNMVRMFSGCTVFNQPLNHLDVSSVTSLEDTFNNCSAFNQPLNSWDTGLVEETISTFQNCTSFDQDLGGWDVTAVFDATTMFSGATLSTANYDALLIGWEGQLVMNFVPFHGGSSTYSAGAAATARANLIADHTWSITDGGPA
jgi:hypothetical protein